MGVGLREGYCTFKGSLQAREKKVTQVITKIYFKKGILMHPEKELICDPLAGEVYGPVVG